MSRSGVAIKPGILAALAAIVLVLQAVPAQAASTPVARFDSYSAREDVTLNVAKDRGLLANDEGANETRLAQQAQKGTVRLASNGAFTYVPDNDATGSDSFRYKACNGNNRCDEAGVQVTIGAVNDAPTAANNSFGATEDKVLAVAAPGVNNNDRDVDGDAVSAFGLVSNASHGRVALAGNGSFTYTPAADYSGYDSFTYRSKDPDGSLSNVATVALQVAPVNDAPVARGDAATTAEDAARDVSVLSNDSDADGDALVLVSATDPAHGTATVVGNQVRYAPDLNYGGPDSFEYTVGDGKGLRATATVLVTVEGHNDAPVASPDSASTGEDEAVVVDALLNDLDADGDALTVSEAGQGSHGAVSKTEDGKLRYAPNRDYNGTDTFTYAVSDGRGGSATGTVTVAVGARNDLPVAVADARAVREDGSVYVPVMDNDSDPDGDKISIVSGGKALHGRVSCNAGGCYYEPQDNFSGRDSFAYTIGDGHGGRATGVVRMTVNPVNDAPVARMGYYTLKKNGVLRVAAPGVLRNDTDADGDRLRVVNHSQTRYGTVENMGFYGSFRYKPKKNWTGTTSFVYRISDGNGGTASASVRIRVKG